MVNKSLRPFLVCCIIYIAITLLLPQKVNAEGPTITGLSSTEIKPDSILEIRGTQLGGAESLKYNVLIYRFVNGFETLFTLYDVLEKESNNQLIKIKFQNKDEFQKFPEAVGQKWKLRVIRPYDKRIAEANQELTVIGEVPKSYLIDTTISVTCGEGGNKKALPNQDVKLLASIPESVGTTVRIFQSGEKPTPAVYSILSNEFPTVTFYFSVEDISTGNETIKADPSAKWVASLSDGKFSQEEQPFKFHYPKCPTSKESPPQQFTEIPTKTITLIHGTQDKTPIVLLDNENQISVGSRTYFGGNIEQCAPGDVVLIFEKIENGELIPIPISKTSVGTGNVSGEVTPAYHTCYSYWTSYNGPGTYRLTAFYQDKEDNGKLYTASGGSLTLEISKKGKQNVATIQTITEIEVGNIQGIAVKKAGSRIELTNDPGITNTAFQIIPKTFGKNESCDAGKIPTVNLVIKKTLKNGSLEEISNEPEYPNCQPKTITESQLGSLDQIDNLEIQVNYTNDDNSVYDSSQKNIIIPISSVANTSQGGETPGSGTQQAVSQQVSNVTISNYIDFRSDNAPGDIGSPTIIVPTGSTIDLWALSTLDTEPYKRVYFREIKDDEYTDYIILLTNNEEREVAGIKIKAELPKKAVKMTVIINGENRDVDVNNPTDINYRLAGTEGQAQKFIIPYVIEYSNGEVEHSAFEIDYQPPKLCECTYPQECTTADNREGTQVCNGVWKAGLGSDCIWDESGGCDPGCNVNTCVANPSPTSTPAPTVTPDPGCPVETCTYSTSVSASSCASGTAICKGTGCSGFNCTKGDGSGCDYQACLNTGSDPGGCECYVPSATPTPSPATPTPSPSPAGKTLTGWYCGGVNGNSIFERYSEGSIAYSCTCGSNSGDCWSSDGTAATICQSKTPSWPYTEDAKCVKPAPSCTEGEIVRNECTRCRGSHQICKHADCSEYICIEDEDNTACDWFNCPPPTSQCTGEDWTKYNLGDYETKCTGSCIRDGCYPGNYTGGEQVYRQCGANGNWGGWQGQCSPDCDQYCQ